MTMGLGNLIGVSQRGLRMGYLRVRFATASTSRQIRPWSYDATETVCGCSLRWRVRVRKGTGQWGPSSPSVNGQTGRERSLTSAVQFRETAGRSARYGLETVWRNVRSAAQARPGGKPSPRDFPRMLLDIGDASPLGRVHTLYLLLSNSIT